MKDLTLGKAVDYPDAYSPDLLQAVPRQLSRDNIGLSDNALPFTGEDVWNAYEISWLNLKGKPQVAILECHVPYDSPNLIESKSFKLYLNSFNQESFATYQDVLDLMQTDLSKCAGAQVRLVLVPVAEFTQQYIGDLPGHVIDDLDVEISGSDILNEQLKSDENTIVNETLVSHLLKSNCLITNQPDWGSLCIRYQGPKIDQASLLKYVISFRQHNEFHEQCVERIFKDLLDHCRPTHLTVYARYTRRGGLDINPFRSNFESTYPNVRLARQ
ncbi:NADPH-dependent 7-cyano-7-deazaguanine reductase QueF [Glaciecola sp. 1036]|uniref:NADPH-dependent 7-cyano-7-deazaguanine reductase QueF n=1 Tax=Alteromonadaceae TaxID=72275 RepID=UPI003CFF900D